ncbi:MAG: glycine--tRNA ligase subunit beta [Gammaproteobacteria bacterium]|nr:glycine--tRNA ligase subunit beta [Gammaproteobacteria bacterium]
MSARRDLLVEIGTEELPPKALRRLSEAFASGLRQGLTDAALAPTGLQAFAAPRRLALLIQGVPEQQPDRENLRRGPAMTAAFDGEGNATKAAQGFAASCGVTVEELDQLETDKGSFLSYRAVEPGQQASALIPDLVRKALAGLPIPKRMRWGAGTDEFVRPVHWVVLLFGDQVIEAEILGVTAGRETRGHRFHHPEPLYLAEPQAYGPLLATQGHVLADLDARREAVRAQVLEAGERLGGRAMVNDDLLDEVTALVEWPVAVSGRFDTRFLEVPAEALISSMQDHQKYFPVVDHEGKLLPHFITIANLDSRDPDQVRAGNERVIRPRLADAAFFWTQDRKQRLEERIPRLQTMVFQQRLGTLADKQQRVAELAGHIAATIGGNADLARRAAALAKCDLVTQMVFEFPELQGIMGRYYAGHDGEPEEVAVALDEQYRPRFAGDDLPAHVTGQALALADRLDSLVGIFAIGQPPSGDKDPFGLRRAALGVLRILIEGERDLDLHALLVRAADLLPADLKADQVVDAVFDYMMERLRGYYADSGIAIDTFDAVLARRPTRPLDFQQRLRAVEEFRQLAESPSLAAANKRIRNILRKTEEAIPEQIDAALLREDAERELAQALDGLADSVGAQFDAGQYTEGLQRLAALRAPVDRFFDEVMVMVDEPGLRANRLALLGSLEALFLRVADLSRLQG